MWAQLCAKKRLKWWQCLPKFVEMCFFMIFPNEIFQQQAPPRQQDNFFQISPRPFAIQPNGNHGIQFVRPPIVPQSQQYTADQNTNPFQFGQQSFAQQRPILHQNANSLEQHQQSALQQVNIIEHFLHRNYIVEKIPCDYINSLNNAACIRLFLILCSHNRLCIKMRRLAERQHSRYTTPPNLLSKANKPPVYWTIQRRIEI